MGHAHPTTQTYLRVYLALLILTVLTVAVSYLPLPALSTWFLAIVIASAKATLVALFFMHLRYDPPLLRWMLGFSVFLLIWLVALMGVDFYFARGGA